MGVVLKKYSTNKTVPFIDITSHACRDNIHCNYTQTPYGVCDCKEHGKNR